MPTRQTMRMDSRLLCLPSSVLFLRGLLDLLRLGLLLARLLLIQERLRLCLLGLHLVDRFHKHTLVLVAVTLGLAVEEVVQVLVDLLGLPVLPEQATENTLTAHPKHFRGQACLAGAAAL